jgi:hypothetical protein
MKTNLFREIVQTHGCASLLLLLLAFAGCEQKQDGGEDGKQQAALTLSVASAKVTVAAAGGNYSIAVTSNTAWAATVNSAAAWCTLTGATATGDGTVAVVIAENPTVVQRVATITVAAGTLTATVTVAQGTAYVINEVNNPPPHAASSYVWQFGTSTLTWSDAIHIPECNKSSFSNSDTSPQCRSYTSGTSTWYYYNWPYVNKNASLLCPSPWRVPAHSDLSLLAIDFAAAIVSTAWGCGGHAGGSSMYYVSTYGYDWSSEEYSSGSNGAYYLYYYSGNLNVSYAAKYIGFQVRCVRD